jgi:hypothetical protein
MEPAEITLELSPHELGERLSDVRLVPSSDATMESSLRRYGQLSPLVAFRDEQQRLEVIDGFRRLRATAQLGAPARLLVRVLEVDEVRALSALFALHRRGTGLTEIEEGWVVQALVREQKMAQTQVAQLLRRDQSWVSRGCCWSRLWRRRCRWTCGWGWSARRRRARWRLPRGIQQVVARVIAQQGMSTRAAAKRVAQSERLQPTTAEAVVVGLREATATGVFESGVLGWLPSLRLFNLGSEQGG